MRKAGYIVALAHKVVKENIKPGMTTKDIDQLVEETIVNNDAIPSFKGYNGFPSASCISVNEVVVHGIPSDLVLKEGDIVSVDIGAEYKGYHGDSAWTYAVGNISEEKQQLMKVTEECLFKGLEQAKNGNRVGHISYAIENHAKKYNYGVVEEFTGHGIGSKLHESPYVPNFGKEESGAVLKSGMTIAVEPMINHGTKRVKVLRDNWTTVTKDKSASAHFEHTILVTDDGYEILTKL